MQHTFMLIALVSFGDSASAVEGIPLSDGEEEARFDYHDPDIAFERCGSGSVSNCFGTLPLQCMSNLFAKFPLEFLEKKTPVREW